MYHLIICKMCWIEPDLWVCKLCYTISMFQQPNQVVVEPPTRQTCTNFAGENTRHLNPRRSVLGANCRFRVCNPLILFEIYCRRSILRAPLSENIRCFFCCPNSLAARFWCINSIMNSNDIMLTKSRPGGFSNETTKRFGGSNSSDVGETRLQMIEYHLGAQMTLIK